MHSRTRGPVLQISSRFVTILRGLMLLWVAAAVAACSADAEQPRTLPPAPSASPTAAAALPVPPEATPETAQGAAAFARYFFEQVNAAYERREPELVRRLSTAECGSCAAVADDVARIRAANHVVEGDRYALTFAEAAPADENGRIIVDFGYNATPYVERDAENAVVKEFPAESGQEGQAMLIRVDGRWAVEAIRLLTS